MRLHSSVLKDLTGLELYPVVIFINVALHENSIAIYKVKERWTGLFGGVKKKSPFSMPSRETTLSRGHFPSPTKQSLPSETMIQLG